MASNWDLRKQIYSSFLEQRVIEIYWSVMKEILCKKLALDEVVLRICWIAASKK